MRIGKKKRRMGVTKEKETQLQSSSRRRRSAFPGPHLFFTVKIEKKLVRCPLEQKPSAISMSLNPSMVASLMAAAAAAMTTTAGPAMALVDERLSTEGTGLPFGLSNNLLG
ncbi:Uncharacterized protein TCM_026323 [Theobroma cacao]|uniref:PSII 6.1 kDa protein n=1 Tax=Theobroma cacao TaxID=3641 RepID=A0A061F970_THECC|nr:Uncharacterized protein TCM_026323 [Theobroma cacao]